MNTKKRRGYIYVEVETDVKVDVNDFLEEVEDDDLLKEVKSRKLLAKLDSWDKPIPKEGTELRKLLCDILDLSYHSSDINILDGIKEKLL